MCVINFVLLDYHHAYSWFFLDHMGALHQSGIAGSFVVTRARTSISTILSWFLRTDRVSFSTFLSNCSELLIGILHSAEVVSLDTRGHFRNRFFLTFLISYSVRFVGVVAASISLIRYPQRRSPIVVADFRLGLADSSNAVSIDQHPKAILDSVLLLQTVLLSCTCVILFQSRNDRRDYAPSRRSKSEGPPGTSSRRSYILAYGSPSPECADYSEFDADYVVGH